MGSLGAGLAGRLTEELGGGGSVATSSGSGRLRRGCVGRFAGTKGLCREGGGGGEGGFAGAAGGPGGGFTTFAGGLAGGFLCGVEAAGADFGGCFAAGGRALGTGLLLGAGLLLWGFVCSDSISG